MTGAFTSDKTRHSHNPEVRSTTPSGPFGRAVRNITPHSARTPSFHYPIGTRGQPNVRLVFILYPANSMGSCETTYRLSAPRGMCEEVIFESLDGRLQLVEDFTALAVPMDLGPKRSVPQSCDGVVYLSPSSEIAPQVLELFARVVGGSAHVVHGGGVYFGAVDREATPHTRVYLGVPAHDDVDVLGGRSTTLG